MKHIKVFKCEFCGKEFSNKENKTFHLKYFCKNNPNINLEKRKEWMGLSTNSLQKYQRCKYGDYVLEKVICKRCGTEFVIKKRSKIKNKKYFCSLKCSNSHKKSDLQKQHMSKKILFLIKTNQIPKARIRIVEKFPIICKKCGNVFYVLPHKTNRKYCSIACSMTAKKGGGYREHNKTHIYGYFDKIWFQSSWELAFIFWCKYYGVPIKRCKEVILYADGDGNFHKYYPDFVINNRTTIEIKGCYDKYWKYKKESICSQTDFYIFDKTNILFFISFMKKRLCINLNNNESIEYMGQ